MLEIPLEQSYEQTFDLENSVLHADYLISMTLTFDLSLTLKISIINFIVKNFIYEIFMSAILEINCPTH